MLKLVVFLSLCCLSLCQIDAGSRHEEEHINLGQTVAKQEISPRSSDLILITITKIIAHKSHKANPDLYTVRSLWR